MTTWRVFLAALALVAVFVLSVEGFAKDSNQAKCPVLSAPINKKVYTDYQGKRIYFCCPPCIPQFNKNPEKYMKQLEKEGVILEDAPPAKKG